ncbi:MAG TPA: hypothetical protein VHL78_01755 [Actinomycetota bacterium]|nr:hypothetical protein [Actinomycetota bacterium]
MRRGVVIAAVAAGVAAAACGGDGGGRTGRADPGTDARTPGATIAVGTTEWVAVFETAADPNDLEAQQAELLERVEGAILVGPAGCHEGLASALNVDRGTYVIGVVGSSEAQMERAVQRAEREPIFRGELKLLCGA